MKAFGGSQEVKRRVIGYVRVSTEGQADSGAGLEAQRAAILSECDRRGWVLAEMVEDAGFSGKSLKRPGIRRALDTLGRGGADVLMASKLDRLSRSVKDFCEVMDESNKRGWALTVLDLGVDTSTPAGRVMANVMASFAQFEREMIGARTREALNEKRKQGVRLGRPVETDTATIDRVTDLRREGMTLRAITERLNAEGVPTARGRGQWHLTQVSELVKRAM